LPITPLRPHTAQSGFKMCGETRCVEERRHQHLLPKPVAQGRQALQVAGAPCGTDNVVVGIGGDPFGQAVVVQAQLARTSIGGSKCNERS